jgi:hypothetical protein
VRGLVHGGIVVWGVHVRRRLIGTRFGACICTGVASQPHLTTLAVAFFALHSTPCTSSTSSTEHTIIHTVTFSVVPEPSAVPWGADGVVHTSCRTRVKLVVVFVHPFEHASVVTPVAPPRSAVGSVGILWLRLGNIVMMVGTLSLVCPPICKQRVITFCEPTRVMLIVQRSARGGSRG